jgi:hypothetical protein
VINHSTFLHELWKQRRFKNCGLAPVMRMATIPSENVDGAAIDRERPDGINLSSGIRLFVLRHFRNATPAAAPFAVS